MEDKIFNVAKQHQTLDSSGDVSEDESGNERDESEGEVSRDIGGGELSSVHTNFELDELINMGSTFLQGMLSEKEPVGFSANYKLPRQPNITGDMAMDNEAPTDDDWENL